MCAGGERDRRVVAIARPGMPQRAMPLNGTVGRIGRFPTHRTDG